MKILISIIVILAIITGLYFWFRQVPMPPMANVVTPVVVKKPTVKNIPIEISTVGQLLATQQTQIKNKVPGYIAKIYFKQGQLVHKGQLLVQLKNQAQLADYQKAQSVARIAKINLEKSTTLLKSGGISSFDLQKLKATYHQDVAAEKVAQITYQQTFIRAPFAGFVSAKTVSIGDYLQEGDAVVNLVNRKNLQIEYSIPAKDYPMLKLGQVVTVDSSTYPNKHFVGKLTYIAPSIENNAQSVMVRATIPNPDLLLVPGEFVNLTQTIGYQKDAILIPEIVLRASVSGFYVYIVKDGKAMEKKVEIGQHIKGMVVITKGLSANQPIMYKGEHVVDPGQQVKIVSENHH